MKKNKKKSRRMWKKLKVKKANYIKQCPNQIKPRKGAEIRERQRKHRTDEL